jgi:hypothetical protein
MKIRNSLFMFLAIMIGIAGCGGSIDWEPVSDEICHDYAEHLEILKSVRDESDALAHEAKFEQWKKKYEGLDARLTATVLRLRDSGGSLDFQKFDELKRRWAKIDEAVLTEVARLQSMNGMGPDYDQTLGKFHRTVFSNPFR